MSEARSDDHLFDAAPEPMKLWHRYMQTDDPAVLDALLADEAVFESPIVHTPQVGKAITTVYLRSAAKVLGGETFTYVNTWFSERSAVLEFESLRDGIKINGVDIIFWNAEGRIDRFKVMVRPLKAINALHAAMAAQLSAMKPG
jgi:hypothetical protein